MTVDSAIYQLLPANESGILVEMAQFLLHGDCCQMHDSGLIAASRKSGGSSCGNRQVRVENSGDVVACRLTPVLVKHKTPIVLPVDGSRLTESIT